MGNDELSPKTFFRSCVKSSPNNLRPFFKRQKMKKKKKNEEKANAFVSWRRGARGAGEKLERGSKSNSRASRLAFSDYSVTGASPARPGAFLPLPPCPPSRGPVQFITHSGQFVTWLLTICNVLIIFLRPSRFTRPRCQRAPSGGMVSLSDASDYVPAWRCSCSLAVGNYQPWSDVLFLHFINEIGKMK